MSQAVDDLWMVAGGLPHVDANALAAAVESAVRSPEILDYRTRLLVRDSLHALRAHWGDSRFQAWLDRSPVRAEIEAAADPSYFDPDPDEIGFPSLERRVMDVIHPDQVQRFLRDLSARLTRPTRLVIGGSIALILSGELIRYTDDIDVVDEVPAQIRDQHQLLAELLQTYKLRLAHFQSHYLPKNWQNRLRSYGTFGQLQVFLVNPYDIFVGKLFSARRKDRADLNALTARLDHSKIIERLHYSTAALRADPHLLEAAKENWYILFGEDLPA